MLCVPHAAIPNTVKQTSSIRSVDFIGRFLGEVGLGTGDGSFRRARIGT